MTDTAQRIAKLIAHAGYCSRRDAEKLIEEGRVSVDGTNVTTPAFKLEDPSLIRIDGKQLMPQDDIKIWLFHKPKGVITTHKDPQGRPTLFEQLPASMPRVISVGRLDFNTEGLILLTNNGEVSRHLELPATGWIRKYRVRIFGLLDKRRIEAIAKGVTIDGIRYAPAKITMDTKKEKGRNQWLDIAITEGKNREVRKLLEYAGLTVTRLIRTAYGPFQLGTLPIGEVKEVPPKQIKAFLGPSLKKF